MRSFASTEWQNPKYHSALEPRNLCGAALAAQRTRRAARRARRKLPSSEVGSPAFLSVFAGRHQAGSFNSCAQGERHVFVGYDARLPHDDDTGDDAKSNLRCHEPGPIDVPLEHRIEKAHNGVQQARPQNRSDHTSEKNGMASEHRKHRTIEQSHKDGGEEM